MNNRRTIKDILIIYIPFIIISIISSVFFRHESGGDIAIVASLMVFYILYIFIWLLIHFNSPIKYKLSILLILLSLGLALYTYLKVFIY